MPITITALCSDTRTPRTPYALGGISGLRGFGCAAFYGALFADSMARAADLAGEMAHAGGVDIDNVSTIAADLATARTVAALPTSRRSRIIARASQVSL